MASSLRELVVSVTVDSRRYQSEMARVSRMGASYAQTFRQGSEQMTRGWNQQTAAARTHATAMQGASQALARYAAVAASAFGLGQLAQVADSWTNISNRLRLVTDSSESFARAQADVLRIAQATRQPLDATAELYQRIAMNQDALGLSGQEMARVVETISKTMVISGTSAAGAQAALVQLGQAFASGTLRGEELNSVLEQAPALAQAIAKGLGVTVGQLREMGKEGQLTAQQVISALQRQSGAVDEAFGSMEVTIGQAMTNLRTAFQVFVGQSADVSGASSAIAEAINLIARNMDAIATVGGAAAIGALAGKLVELSRAAVGATVEAARSAVAARAEALAYRDATAAALAKAQADVRRAQAAMTATRGTAESARQSRNLAAALLAERQAAVAAAAAQTAYARATSVSAAAGRAALGLLGGPAGLAVTVGMVAAGWLLFRDNSSEATRALQEMTGPLDEVLGKFRELGELQQMQAIRDAEQVVADSTKRMRRSLEELHGTFSDWNVAPTIRGIQRDYEAGAISLEDASGRIAEAIRRANWYSQASRDSAIEAAAAWEENAGRVAEAQRRLDGMRQVQEAVPAAVDAATAAVDRNADAMKAAGDAAAEAGKKIQNAIRDLPGQIERVGKSAREVARLDVRDWFRAEAAAGVNFNDRANPRVQELIRQGAQYISLQAQLAAAQESNTRATRIAASAEKEAAKAQRERIQAAGEYLAGLNEAYASQVQGLEREIALYGQVGQAAQMAYDLANGALSGLQQAQKDRLLQLAQERDALEANARAAADYAALAQKYATPRERAQVEAKDDRASAWMALIGGEVDDAGYQELMDRIDAKARQTTDNMTIYAEQAGRNIQSYLGDSMYDILDGRFSDIGDSFANMLKRMVAELAASQLLNVLGGAMAGYGGTGTWGNLIRGIGGALKTSGSRAGGGRVEAFKAYDIAEHGQPEILSYGGRNVLIMGAQGGMVSPLMNVKGGGGGMAPQVNVTIHNAPAGTTAKAAPGPGGSLNLDVIVGAIESRIAGRVASGSSPLNPAIRGRYGLREAV